MNTARDVFLRKIETGVQYTSLNLSSVEDIFLLQYLIVFGIKWQKHMENLSLKEDLRLRLVKQYST